MSLKHTLVSTNSQFKLWFGPLHRISWIRFAIQSFFRQESFCIVHVTFCCQTNLQSRSSAISDAFPEIYSIFLIFNSCSCWWQWSFVPLKFVSCSFLMHGFIFSKAWWFHIEKVLSDQYESQQWYVIFYYSHSCGCLFHRSFGIRHTILWAFKSIFKGKK